MDTYSLIEKAHQGDKEARGKLIEDNLGLVWSVVKRFYQRSKDTEDLFQMGVIGLIKAIDHFDLSYQVKFSTYAVPMIAGEIKCFLRDDGMIKVSRSLKEICNKAMTKKEELQKEKGREPALDEIAASLQIKREDLVFALESQSEVESFQKTIYQGDGEEIYLLDKLGCREEEGDQILSKVMLEAAMKKLSRQEQILLYLRYFQDQTQAQIAKRLGVSQVQVSRLEKKILKQMRIWMNENEKDADTKKND